MSNLIKGSKLLLNSQAYLDFQNPDDCDFKIEDIAQGLANTCRFGGQCSRFYSVAEHSVFASYLVPKEHAYEALMHDAAEAFIGDIPSPLKMLLPDYMRIESRINFAISKAFKVPYPFSADTKIADMQLLAVEQTQVMENDDCWQSCEGFAPAETDIVVQFWDPETAYNKFLARYKTMRGEW